MRLLPTPENSSGPCCHARQLDVLGRRLPCAVPWCADSVKEDVVTVEWARPAWPGRVPERTASGPERLTVTYVRGVQHVARQGLKHVWRRIREG